MSLYFRPEKGVLGDMIPFYDNGVFKPFYLRNYRGNRDAQHQDSWVMLSTTDHIHFQEHDTKIVGGTGSVIYVDGLYHMFFCTFQVFPEKNYINHAVSKDLDTWMEIEEDRFASDNVIYAPVHWRDPFVFWSEEESCWWMIFAAQKKGNTTRRGCVGLCKSDDLHTWRYCEPFYAPMNAQCAFECPDFFKMGDWYYLVFSSYADRYQTLYRKSKSPYGPWQTPEIDTFDTRAFYAAKTGTDGVHRYVYGWNPTREDNEHHFDPMEYDGKDCNTWDWGGNLIVHELWQEENGDLFAKPLDTILKETDQKMELSTNALTGNWEITGDCADIQVPYQYGALLLNPLQETSRLSFDVEVKGENGSIGVAIHVDEDFAVGYYIHIDFSRRRMEFKSSVRMTERGGQMFPYEVELERPLSSLTTNRFHVDVIASDTILEAYVDNRVVLGTRMFDITGGCFGIYASEIEAHFSNLQVSHRIG